MFLLFFFFFRLRARLALASARLNPPPPPPQKKKETLEKAVTKQRKLDLKSRPQSRTRSQI